MYDESGFFLVALIIGLVFSVFLSWLVGKFAENRGRSFGFGFLISFLLSPLVGFVIVYVVTADYHSDGLGGARLTPEEFIRAEEIKLQLRRTELRWKVFQDLLYLSLLAGAACFFYHHPEPVIRIRDAFFSGHNASTTSSTPVSSTRSPVEAAPQDTDSLPLTPTPPLKQYRYYITQPASIQTKYGIVTFPVHTEVRLLQETSTSVTARAMGYDFQLQPSQITRVAN